MELEDIISETEFNEKLLLEKGYNRGEVDIYNMEELLLKSGFDKSKLEKIKSDYLNNQETGGLDGYVWHLKEEVKVYCQKSE